MAFRERVYHQGLGRRADAQFELLDALSVAGPVSCVAALSLQAGFRRGWGSAYAALAHGEVVPAALRTAVAAVPLAEGEAIYAVDVSVWPRPAAKTSAERGYHYSAQRHLGGQPVVAGWAYQWVAQLSFARDSWTAPVEVTRVRPSANANQVAVEQMQRLLPVLPPTAPTPLFVFDAGYDPVALTRALGDAPLGVLVRLRANRCFYAEPPPGAPGTPGRPPQHGAKLACGDPTTWVAPDATTAWEDAEYGAIRIRAWTNHHANHHAIPRDHPARGTRAQRGHIAPVRGTIVLVEVAHLPDSRRLPQRLWLWWHAPVGTPLDLPRLWHAYRHRFDLEHTFRLCKQRLDWILPHLRTPEQADRWSWLVLVAYTQLRLARPLVNQAPRLPWQRPQPVGHPTPTRVQQALPALLAQVGTPARAAQPCGRSPGRPPGRRSPPAPRYRVRNKSG